jgi:phosphoadenosine phosphosulfate reductase
MMGQSGAPAGKPASLGEIAALLPSAVARVARARDLLAGHMADHPGYVAWSGGRDSTCALLLARQVDPQVPVAWFDSGLEYPETRVYLEQVAERLQVNLHVFAAVPDALTMLRETGAWDHAAAFRDLGASGSDFHTVLLSEPSRRAHERFGVGEISGLRAGESVGRRVLLASGRGLYQRNDGACVCAPVWRWSLTDVRGFLAREGIPENPVYARLEALGAPQHAQRVGLVVDGNAAEYGRYTWLRTGWPDMWETVCEALPRLREWR